MELSRKVKVEIAGADYVVNTNESEGYMLELSSEMSRDIEALMERNLSLSLNDALVLCAISYLDAYKKENANSDHIREQMKDYIADTARARMEADEATRRADRLSAELKRLGHNV